MKHSAAKPPDHTRRKFLKAPLALAASSVVLPPLLRGQGATAAHPEHGLSIAPRYFPLETFEPEVDISGKLAVVTGASRGNGRAVGEALRARGADVIGTSRHPATVPNPPDFPLLALDIADPGSVLAFAAALQAHPLFQQHGQLDILCNNAGRFVIGGIVPLSAADFPFYLAQRDLGLHTVYFGHTVVTNALLPVMPLQSYARIIFTASIAAYTTGATFAGESFFDTYNAGKFALRVYANNLDAALREAGLSARVSTVNPYAMNTELAKYPHPVYTQEVNGSGFSDTDATFNLVMNETLQLLANGLPPAMVGEAYAQLLGMSSPLQNVVVASPRPPLAAQGANAIVEQQLFAENEASAVPFRAGR